MLRLRTFGGLSIERSDEGAGAGSPVSTATSARRRLAFLAVLAASGPRGVPREKLLALFWPESDSDKARHALDQTLYSLKRDLGAESLVNGREELSINAAAMSTDIEDFKALLARGERQAAVDLYTGPFLDGVFISGAPGFERWAEEERGRLTREVESALESLATEAANRGDHAGAVQRWQRLAAMEPRKTRVVLSLMSELAASGDRAGALRHAEIYHTLVHDDLDAEPNPAVAVLADRLRREPTVAKVPSKPAPRVTAAVERLPALADASEATEDISAPRPASRGPHDTSRVPHDASPGPQRTSRVRRPTVEWLRQRTTRAYRIAGVTAAIALLLALSLAWIVVGKRRDADRGWILAADFENHTRDSIFDGALDAALLAGLQQSQYINVFPRARVQQTLLRMRRAPSNNTPFKLDESLARDVAQREGIRAVVSAAIDRIDSNYILTARLVDATSGVTLAAESRVAAHRAEIIDAVDDLVRRLRRRIGESAEAIAKHDLPLPQATTSSLEALHKYADGMAAFRAGQRKAALELYKEAVALDTDFALAHSQLGASYYWNNDRPNGDAHFEHALRLLDRLTDRERLLVRASAASWRGNREEAITLRRALLTLYPGDRAAWANIGYDYMRLGRANEAIDALGRQLERDTTDASSYINLASSYKQLGRFDDAIRAYHRAFALQPSWLTLENLNHEYGATFVLAGRPELARAVHDSMLTGDGDQKARGYRSLGLVAMSEGRYTEAIDRFRQAILFSLAPNRQLTEARNRLFLASAEQEKGWRDSASAQIRQAHALFKTTYFEPTFLLYLGKALARDGQLPLAQEVFDTLQRRIRQDNAQDRATGQVLDAEMVLARGNPQRAIDMLKAASAADSSAYVRESLAYAMAHGSNPTAAAALYDSLATATAGWYGWEAESYVLSAPALAGRLYESAGNPSRARVAYERALGRWPRGDTDLVTSRASREALARLRKTSGALTPSAR